MNKRYLNLQSIAPGSAAEVLHNSREAMNRFVLAKKMKEEMAQGGSPQQTGGVYNLSDFNGKSEKQNELSVVQYNIATDVFEENSSLLQAYL